MKTILTLCLLGQVMIWKQEVYSLAQEMVKMIGTFLQAEQTAGNCLLIQLLFLQLIQKHT